MSEFGKNGKSIEEEGNSSRVSVYSGTGTIAQSSVYEIINKAVNKEKLTIAFPKTFLKRV